ncbi:MAG: DUF309 domain-containing protein [bacterium]
MQPARRKKQLVTKVITVPRNLQLGCDEFNAELFYECHERFEEIWQLETGPVRDLYKGLIQIAAGFVHLQRGKYIGAERLLRTGVGYLAPYRATGAMGFDIDAISTAAEGMHGRLVAAGADGVGTLDLRLRPFYVFDPAKLADEAKRWRAWGFDEAGNAEPMTITVAE